MVFKKTLIYSDLIEKTVFFPIPHTKLEPPKTPNKMVNKNDCRNPVPSQPVTKHSYIPLVHKRSVIVTSLSSNYNAEAHWN